MAHANEGKTQWLQWVHLLVTIAGGVFFYTHVTREVTSLQTKKTGLEIARKETPILRISPLLTTNWLSADLVNVELDVVLKNAGDFDIQPTDLNVQVFESQPNALFAEVLTNIDEEVFAVPSVWSNESRVVAMKVSDEFEGIKRRVASQIEAQYYQSVGSAVQQMTNPTDQLASAIGEGYDSAIENLINVHMQRNALRGQISQKVEKRDQAIKQLSGQLVAVDSSPFQWKVVNQTTTPKRLRATLRPTQQLATRHDYVLVGPNRPTWYRFDVTIGTIEGGQKRNRTVSQTCLINRNSYGHGMGAAPAGILTGMDYYSPEMSTIPSIPTEDPSVSTDGKP